MSLNDWVKFFANDDNSRVLMDFKPILDLDLYGEHVPDERITGSKIDLGLSAGSTYTLVYTVISLVFGTQDCLVFYNMLQVLLHILMYLMLFCQTLSMML